MHVIINGEKKAFGAALNIQELLATLRVDTRQVAVEQNGAIVPKSRYGETPLAEGDALEIVGFIGGG